MMGRRLIALMCFACVLSLAGTASADLILHWALDDAAGNVAADSSGNGRDGDVGGTATWVEGVIKGALELDGSSTYIDYNEQIVAGTCSIALWLTAPDLPIATVATGTPDGIWTVERSASAPPRAPPPIGTPITGRVMWAATVPARCAAPPAAAMITPMSDFRALIANSRTTSGLRCADMTCVSL